MREMGERAILSGVKTPEAWVKSLFLTLGLAACSMFCARADDQLVPLVVQGSWAAFEHLPDVTSPPDVCAAMQVGSGFTLRQDGSSLQIRVQNDSWSLPAGVQGNITLVIGSVTKTYEVDDNTSTMVNAEFPPDDAPAILSEMANGATMTFQVGKAMPVAVPLDGSKVVLQAFRTCAGIEGDDSTPASNPFK